MSSHGELTLLAPKIPLELIYLVGKPASFEVRAILTRCNKQLFNICNLLLYRDIYLYTPTQLVKLFRCKKNRPMLQKTKSMFISEIIFHREAWEGIQGRLDPEDYLLRVLHVAVSLRRLQTFQSNLSYRFSDDRDLRIKFENKLLRQTFNPAFLPRLAMLVRNSTDIQWTHLSDERPVAYFSHLYVPYLWVTIFPTLRTLERDYYPTSALALSRIARCPDRSLSASDIGWFIRESLDAPSRSMVEQLMLTVYLADAVGKVEPSPACSTLSWIQDMLAAAGCFQFDTLFVFFQLGLPSDQPLSLDAQHSTLTELLRILPKLVHAMISTYKVVWRRRIPKADKAASLRPRLPEWTPCPRADNLEVLTWWLNALDIPIPRSQDHEALGHTVRQLREEMYMRWDYDVHSEEKLRELLITHLW